MFTDIVSSTELWERHPVAMDLAIREHDAMLSEAVRAHGGDVIAPRGDGLYATFELAQSAVRAAIAIQEALRQRTFSDVGQLAVRIGLHADVCRVHLGQVYGRPVNLAARIEAAAHGGQILLSDAVRAAAVEIVGEECVSRLGPYRFRGIDAPVIVHTITGGAFPLQFPPPRTEQPGPEELPLVFGPLVGRDAEVAAVSDAVRASRVVTLTGPGGVGKTRVALRVAELARRPFGDGVRFADLRTAAAFDDVADAVLMALRAAVASKESTLQALIRSMRPIRVLAVLDNCERAREPVADLVWSIVQACPTVHFLLTSRAPLGIKGERLIAIAPLSVPHDGAKIEEIAGSPAVQQFVSRAQESDPGFTLTGDTATPVAELCRAVDGLPGAIELVAARVDVESVGEMVRSKDDVLRGLTGRGDGRDGLLTASLELAYEALTPGARQLLRGLAAFAGSFTKQAVTGFVPAFDAWHGPFEELVRASLVAHDPIRSERYRLLQTTREFARGKWSPEERLEIERYHARSVVDAAVRWGEEIYGAGEADAVEHLHAWLPDIRSVMTAYMQRGEVDGAARLITSIHQFCQMQLIAEEGTWALELAGLIDDDHELAVEVIGAASHAAWMAGDTDQAIALGERAVAAAHGRAAIWARIALIDATFYSGQAERGLLHAIELQQEIRQTGKPFWMTVALAFDAIGSVMSGRLERAERLVGEALRTAQRLGNPDCIHLAQYVHGRLLAVDRLEDACVAYELAIDAARSVDSRWNLSIDLLEWSEARARLGDIQHAASGLAEVIDLVRGSANRSQMSQAVRAAAFLFAAARAWEAATLALHGRAGLPEMPKGPHERQSDESLSTELEQHLGARYSQLVVKAKGTTEPDLLRRCRDELEVIRSTPAGV
jgi:predicted ATPase/class 3 adenylate cyclase